MGKETNPQSRAGKQTLPPPLAIRAPPPRVAPVRKVNEKRVVAASKDIDHVITYCLCGRQVYSTVAPTFEKAIVLARQSFPGELASIASHQIFFSVMTTTGGERRSTGINATAWKAVTSGLRQYEIVYITVCPTIVVSDADGEVAPPRYSEVDARLEKEEAQASCSSTSAPPPSYTRSRTNSNASTTSTSSTHSASSLMSKAKEALGF